jgi:hypothetical protein
LLLTGDFAVCAFLSPFQGILSAIAISRQEGFGFSLREFQPSAAFSMWGQFGREGILHEKLSRKPSNKGERQSSDEVSKPICACAFTLAVDDQHASALGYRN